jgi:hypothetical protein
MLTDIAGGELNDSAHHHPQWSQMWPSSKRTALTEVNGLRRLLCPLGDIVGVWPW